MQLIFFPHTFLLNNSNGQMWNTDSTMENRHPLKENEKQFLPDPLLSVEEVGEAGRQDLIIPRINKNIK